MRKVLPKWGVVWQTKEFSAIRSPHPLPILDRLHYEATMLGQASVGRFIRYRLPVPLCSLTHCVGVFSLRYSVQPPDVRFIKEVVFMSRAPKKKVLTTIRIALDAVMIAVYIVLSTMLSISLGSSMKITLEPLPVVFCAVAFGPLDAFLVGFFGEFLNQMLTYGFTPTTLLWVAPIVVRGLVIAFSAKLMKRRLSPAHIHKNMPLLIAVSIVAGILHSVINTVALLVDSKLFSYYSYHMVFGVFWWRIGASVISAVIMALIVVPLISALRKANLLPQTFPKFRNADEAIAYIHSVCWKGSTPGLTRTNTLLAKMGNPHKSLKFVHIAGTNGKGSTAAMTASILRKAGYRTGLFTSPYIYRFHERMQVNGVEIPDRDLMTITEFVRPLAASMSEPPTEFELVTCIAMEYFARMHCDIVVLEVGMGGAYDSTNVIDAPEVAVITNIGLDHTEFLGSTVEEIARTKAGIFKEGGSAVVYRSTPSVEAVFEEVCKERNVRLKKADFDGLKCKSHGLEGQVFDCGDRKDIFLPLLGDHQLHNAAVVLAIADTLKEKGWKITEENIYEGIREVSWPGRFDIMCKDPLFIIDGGHNPQCIEALVKNIQDYLAGKRVIVLTGVLADKDYVDMYKPVMALVEQFVCITPPAPRKLDAEDLACHLRGCGAEAVACDSIPEGVRKAMDLAGKDGVVLSFGSLYSIGAIRDALSDIQ